MKPAMNLRNVDFLLGGGGGGGAGATRNILLQRIGAPIGAEAPAGGGSGASGVINAALTASLLFGGKARPKTTETGTGTDQPEGRSTGTDAEPDQPETAEAGTGTDGPITSETGTSAERPRTSETGTATEPEVPPTVLRPRVVSTSTGTEPRPGRTTSTSTEPRPGGRTIPTQTTTDGRSIGTDTGSNPAISQATGTGRPSTAEVGTQENIPSPEQQEAEANLRAFTSRLSGIRERMEMREPVPPRVRPQTAETGTGGEVSTTETGTGGEVSTAEAGTGGEVSTAEAGVGADLPTAGELMAQSRLDSLTSALSSMSDRFERRALSQIPREVPDRSQMDPEPRDIAPQPSRQPEIAGEESPEFQQALSDAPPRPPLTNPSGRRVNFGETRGRSSMVSDLRRPVGSSIYQRGSEKYWNDRINKIQADQAAGKPLTRFGKPYEQQLAEARQGLADFRSASRTGMSEQSSGTFRSSNTPSVIRRSQQISSEASVDLPAGASGISAREGSSSGGASSGEAMEAAPQPSQLSSEIQSTMQSDEAYLGEAGEAGEAAEAGEAEEGGDILEDVEAL